MVEWQENHTDEILVNGEPWLDLMQREIEARFFNETLFEMSEVDLNARKPRKVSADKTIQSIAHLAASRPKRPTMLPHSSPPAEHSHAKKRSGVNGTLCIKRTDSAKDLPFTTVQGQQLIGNMPARQK